MDFNGLKGFKGFSKAFEGILEDFQRVPDAFQGAPGAFWGFRKISDVLHGSEGISGGFWRQLRRFQRIFIGCQSHYKWFSGAFLGSFRGAQGCYMWF